MFPYSAVRFIVEYLFFSERSVIQCRFSEFLSLNHNLEKFSEMRSKITIMNTSEVLWKTSIAESHLSNFAAFFHVTHA